MRRVTRSQLIGAVLLVLGLLAPASASAWSVVGAAPATGHGVFRFPQAIAYSPGGTKVFVADQYSGVVQKFDRSGAWELDVGFYADTRETGRIGTVGGLAVDRDGHLFVLDSENDRVQVFWAEDGRWLGAFGSTGTGAGQFRLGHNTGAGGIAIDQTTAGGPAVVYIADQYNHRIQAFALTERTSSGDRVLPPGARTGDVVAAPAPLRRWGRFGDCAPSACSDAASRSVLNYPQGIAVDPVSRNVLVADDRNHRVVEFTPEGTWVRQVGSFGGGDGEFRFPYDVGVDARSPRQLYVADNNNHRVQAFDGESFAFVRSWGAFGPEPGNLEYTRALGAVADDPTGGVAVADTANNRVQVFAPDGALVAHWGTAGRGPGYVSFPGGVAVDESGRVHVADTFASRVQRLASHGGYLGQTGYIAASSGFAAPASGEGQFNLPGGIAYDPSSGRVWVADTGNDRVQELTGDGAFVAVHGGLGFSDPRAVSVSPSGDVAVADSGNDRVQRLDVRTGAWSVAASGLNDPSGVAFDANRDVLAADTGAGRVVRVPSGGGAPVTVADGLDEPRGLAVHGTTLYVAEAGASRILAISLTDGSRRVLAGEGRDVGSVVAPTGVSVDPAGTVLLVADTGNHRIQRVTLREPDPPPAPSPPVVAPSLPPGPPVVIAPRDRTAPVLRALRLSRSRFRALRRGDLLTRRRLRGGSMLSFRASEPATLTARVRRGSRLVRGTLRIRIAAGPTRIRLTGRLRNRRLRPGTYRLVLTATDAANNRSRAVAVRFTVTR